MKEMSKRLTFEKIDVDEKPELYEELNLNITPTTILYKNGKEVWRCEGMMFDKQYEEMRRM
jgi:thioredoxin-like negative regulator of GroEL